jgi:hypothetical protein
LFSVNLASGKYGFLLYYNVYGWAKSSQFVSVSKTSNYSVSTTKVSFNGGLLTITGSDFSPFGQIKINGLTSTIGKITNTSAQFVIPPLITDLTQSTYNLKAS